MGDLVSNAWVIPLLPLLATIVTAVFGPRLLGERSHWPCVIGSVLAAVLSLAVLWNVVQGGGAESVSWGAGWISVGSFDVPVELTVDPLSSLMLVMVTLVGSLIVIYSIGYMHGDPGYWRFFTYVSLFLFSMTMLVLVSNFVLLFVFWEAVGLCSYLLIGFWYQKPSAARAAKKAFLVNRVGDFAFALGILLAWVTFRDVSFSHAFATAGQVDGNRLLTICLLLFCGAVGKSAQFPLHVWLPDAMEGPSPVSALIHAATMVTAGVYMLARLAPMFTHSPEAQLVIAGTGGLTALLAALIALTQTDLKRILAYSTISQLGYMFLALGCGTALATSAAIFHVFTHAFFKALLFLAAGSVMHAMGGVIDINRIGGLRRRMPVTCWTFACGGLALAGFPLLSGFWSKDEILAAVFERSTGDWGGVFLVLLLAGLLTAFLTAFYTARAFFKVFWGEEQIPEEAGEHAQEGPPVLTVPLIVLAVGAVGVGIALGPTGGLASFLSPESEHHWNLGLLAVSGALALAGLGLGWRMYARPSELPRKLAGLGDGWAYRLSYDKFRFDELYQAVLVGPLVRLAAGCRVFDNESVDGTVDRIAAAPGQLARRMLCRFQNGLTQFYALAMVVGLVIVVLAANWLAG